MYVKMNQNELYPHWVNGSHPMKFWPYFLRLFFSRATAIFSGQVWAGNRAVLSWEPPSNSRCTHHKSNQ